VCIRLARRPDILVASSRNVLNPIHVGLQLVVSNIKITRYILFYYTVIPACEHIIYVIYVQRAKNAAHNFHRKKNRF
jgi:hypothetical protein